MKYSDQGNWGKRFAIHELNKHNDHRDYLWTEVYIHAPSITKPSFLESSNLFCIPVVHCLYLMALTSRSYDICMYICMYVCMLVPESAKVHACLSHLHRQLASRKRHKCCSHIASSMTQLRRAALLLGLWQDSRVVRILEKLALLCYWRVTALPVDMHSYGWAWAAKMLLSSGLGATSRLKTLRLLFKNTQNNPPKESHVITLWTLREARGPMFYGALSERIRSSYSSFPYSLIGEVWRNLDYNSTENHLMVKLRISLSANHLL